MIRFNEVDHTYCNEDGEFYTSVTSFIKQFKKPFERDKIATKYAKKNKRTVEDVIAEWEKISKEATTKGTLYHKRREDELILRGSIEIDNTRHTVFVGESDGEIKLGLIGKLDPGVYPELIVWSDKYKIAGQTDYVEITESGKINITDYKTSKKIDFRSFKSWDGSYQRMNFPINNLEDCNFNHYALQLNLYAYLIKSHNRKLDIGDLNIEHVVGDYDEETNEFILKQINIHKVPDMQRDIKVMLEYYLNKNQ